MKHPKRFCVKCDQKMPMVIRSKASYAVYHCRKCGEEICRVGDGESNHAFLQIRAGIDAMSLSEEVASGMPLTDLACSNPDVLSDDHKVWDSNGEEDHAKGAALRKFAVAFNLLTPRQQQIVLTVEKHGTQEKAAVELGISQQGVAKVLRQVRQKLDGCISDKQGLIGKLTQGDNNVY